MANTSPAVVTGPTVVTGTTVVTGQGDRPLPWILYSTDDASINVPTWNDATASVRSFSSSRGRDSELGEIDAGTAQIVLDNRTRIFDPVNNALIKPLNRWWIREQFTGETQDIYLGYAEAYEQGWDMPNDATATVSCVDEFKVFALNTLPTMNPPRDTYADLIAFDVPELYWPLKDDVATTKSETGNPGPPLSVAGAGAVTSLTSGPIVGDNPSPAAAAVTPIGNALVSGVVAAGDPGDPTGLVAVAAEMWFKTDVFPATGQSRLLDGPSSTLGNTYRLLFNTTGTISFTAIDSGNTSFQAVSQPITLNSWYHVVGTIESGSLRLYLNGTQVASTAWSGTGKFGTIATGSVFSLGEQAASQGASIFNFSNIAIYRKGLDAATVTRHYQAGVQRGFSRGQLPDSRINMALDTIVSAAPRKILPGSRPMIGIFQTGQPVLDELRNARIADNVDAVLFIARDGTATFLGAGHRSSSPYNTVQATFGDAGGAELPYQDLTVDYSDGFLFNAWNVTRDNGLTQSTSDTTSISHYYRRSQSLTSLPIRDDSDATAIAAALLAKYKDPFTRVTSITLTTATPAVSEAIFRRDIGDRIRVLRTPPGGGARIDQTVFIQKIDMSATPDGIWSVIWAITPL